MRTVRASVGVIAALVAWPVAASAQSAPSLDVRTWRPSIDPEASLVLEPPSTPGPWRWNLSAWTHFAGDPVALPGGALRPVAFETGTDVVASIGLGSRVEVGVDVPVIFWQSGTTGLPASVVSGGHVPSSGVGDLAMRVKVTLVSDERAGTHVGFGLAALGGVTVATGDAASFAVESSETASLALLAAYTLGPASVRASAGYGARVDPHVWPDGGPYPGPTYGASVPWAVGMALGPKALWPSLDRADRQEWELAAHGSLPAGPVAPFVGDGAPMLSPALLAVDDRVALGAYHDTYFVAGLDVGLDRAVGVPVVRGVLAIGWAPRSHDKDGDGVDDDADQCPDLPEDRDGIQDQDGCPEDDADDDGVPDAQDACPLVPGVASPVPARNGCPERGNPR